MMAKRTDDYDTDAAAYEPEPARKRAAPSVTRAPDEWRVLLGTRASHYAAARICHGWAEHEYHEGAPLRLSEPAYVEAVAAALVMPPTPSPNALSPHRGCGK
jgi:hypothetical protein